MLRKAYDSNVDWRRFDTGLEPMLDLPVFEHPDGPSRAGRTSPTPAAPGRVVFSYLVPVHVEVEDDQVTAAVVIDETPVSSPTVVEGDPARLDAAVATAKAGPAGASATDPIPTDPPKSPANAPGFVVSGDLP